MASTGDKCRVILEPYFGPFSSEGTGHFLETSYEEEASHLTRRFPWLLLL